jgi:hypothetical protein
VFNSAWTLDSRGDRMGIRLLGTALQYQGKPMISEGIPLGAVQVPPDGQPIVLLNDRQTIGGYPRLGAVDAVGAGAVGAVFAGGAGAVAAGGAGRRAPGTGRVSAAFFEAAKSIASRLAPTGSGECIFCVGSLW